jgi:2-C-methyl-D-erythritol 4-phosphate cytidylyltransferase
MNIALIAAAGSGTRMAGDRPKQFLQLAGIPIVIHTLKAFEQCDSIQEIIVILPVDAAAEFLDSVGRYGLRKVAKVVPGGVTRAESVKRGLIAIRAATAEIVAVHDGVRPFVTTEEITDTVNAAAEYEAAILVSRATDTIKQVRGNSVVKTLERSELRHALTPQCFRYELLRRAYEQIDVADPSLTDDSALVEKLGVKVAVVEGSSRNIKITTPEDLLLAEVLFKEWS